MKCDRCDFKNGVPLGPAADECFSQHSPAPPWERWYLELREALGGPRFPEPHSRAVRYARTLALTFALCDLQEDDDLPPPTAAEEAGETYDP